MPSRFKIHRRRIDTINVLAPTDLDWRKKLVSINTFTLWSLALDVTWTKLHQCFTLERFKGLHDFE